jgi:hypothetical protein
VILRLGTPVLIPVHLAAFFCCAMVCHTQLARGRPDVGHLTEFYLWISLGGVLGGAFNTLVATYVFRGIYEYPLVLALACLLRPSPAYRRGKPEPWPVIAIALAVPVVLCTLLWSAGFVAKSTGFIPMLFGVGTVLAFFVSLANRPAPFNAVMCLLASVVVAGLTGARGDVLFAGRSFFGVMKVLDAPDHSYHMLHHGTTAHGRQDTAAAGRCEPKAYFHPAGPIGQLLTAAGPRFRTAGIIGLGTGSLACYAPREGIWTFYEIDPMVERIARDTNLFTFITNSPGIANVSIGDGRLKLQQAAPASFDLIVLDAFSSDSVPLHLLTREAFQLYLSRLHADGVLALHISNRFLDLEPVVAALGRDEGLHGLANLDVNVTAEEVNAGRLPSHWVLFARTPGPLSTLRDRIGWRTPTSRPGVLPWTDDYSNLLSVLRVGD